MMNQDSKDKIFKNVRKLKNKPNIRVFEQLPAEVSERRKRLWPKYRAAKTNPRNKVSWALDKLVINGVTFTAFDDPQVIDPATDPHTDIDVKHTQHLTEDGSTFMGHSAKVERKTDVSAVMSKILEDRSLAGATHNIYAYRILNEDGDITEGFRDDGEHGAGYKLLEFLKNKEAEDVMVVATRWYGNRHMGPKRFKCIEQCADFALKALNSE
jgi:hypothetical protein